MERVFASRPGWRRVYVDLPGFGASPASEQIRGSDDVLAVVLELLAEVAGDGPAVLVGQSWGAYLANAAAQARPDVVAGLAMLCPMTVPDRAQRDVPPHPDVRARRRGSATAPTPTICASSARSRWCQDAHHWQFFVESVLPGLQAADPDAVSRIEEGYALTPTSAPPFAGPDADRRRPPGLGRRVPRRRAVRGRPAAGDVRRARRRRTPRPRRARGRRRRAARRLARARLRQPVGAAWLMGGISAAYGTRLHSRAEVSRLSPTYQQTQPVPLLSGPEALVVARRFAEEISPGAADRDRAPSSPTAELAGAGAVGPAGADGAGRARRARRELRGARPHGRGDRDGRRVAGADHAGPLLGGADPARGRLVRAARALPAEGAGGGALRQRRVGAQHRPRRRDPHAPDARRRTASSSTARSSTAPARSTATGSR